MEVRRRHTTNKGHYEDEDEDESRPLLYDHDEKKTLNAQAIVSQNGFYESVWQVVSFFWQSLYDTIWSSPPVLDEATKYVINVNFYF